MFSFYSASKRTRAIATGLILGITGAFWATDASAETFSMICMPDPQYYTTSNHPSRFNLYNRQAQWIVNNRNALDIKHVIWLGDLTNDNTLTQWNVADEAYNILDNAGVPFAVVPGNHDYKTSTGWPGANFRNLSRFNNIAGPGRFNSHSWYGGNMGETSNHNENNYTYFSAGGLDFMVVGLEYAPRKEVLTWANNLISAHPHHRVIVFTHSYLTTNGNYGGNAGSATGTVGATGSEIFDECINRHSNVFMVVCGHVTESVTNIKPGVAGNVVYEMLVDYQSEKILGTGANLGNGWLRLLQFNTDTNMILASTFTAAPGDTNIFKDGITKFYQTSRYGESPTDADHRFAMNYNMASMEPYTYLNASLGFHGMSMGSDLHADQLAPAIDQVENGNWAVAWQDDAEDDGIYQIYTRGFDSDGNERFPKQRVNTVGINSVDATNPAMAMAPDGSFVIVWQSGQKAIKMRTFRPDGTVLGGFELPVVNVTGNGQVLNPDVAMDDYGNFVITWADDDDGNGLFQVKAIGFRSNLSSWFTAKTINTNSSGQQQKPKIAMAGNGDHVITWQDDKDGTWDVNVRGFNADGTEKFPQMPAQDDPTGEQRAPDIAMNDDGQFVIVWEDDTDLNNAYQVRAHAFQANGANLFGDITVNKDAAGNQLSPSVDMDSNGHWYCVWEDSGQGGRGFQMMSNAFRMNGTRLNTSDVRANPVTNVTHVFNTPARKQPVISAHRSGRYIVAWADDMDGNDAFQPLARGIPGQARSLVIKHVGGSVTRSLDNPFYAPGDQVTLTAHPDPGYSFVKWSGNVPANSTAESITISMLGNRKVTAEFAPTSDVGEWALY